MSLLQTNSFEHISVSELSVRAEVSRMAFYRHFENSQEVLKGHFRDQRHEFSGWLRNEPGFDRDCRDPKKEVLRYVIDHSPPA